jgi:hypothetical protein
MPLHLWTLCWLGLIHLPHIVLSKTMGQRAGGGRGGVKSGGEGKELGKRTSCVMCVPWMQR